MVSIGIQILIISSGIGLQTLSVDLYSTSIGVGMPFFVAGLVMFCGERAMVLVVVLKVVGGGSLVLLLSHSHSCYKEEGGWTLVLTKVSFKGHHTGGRGFRVCGFRVKG